MKSIWAILLAALIAVSFAAVDVERKTKSVSNENPLDYDLMKVVTLSKGFNPLNEDVKSINDQIKRQASIEKSTTVNSEMAPTSTTTTTTTPIPITITDEPRINLVTDSVSADSDSGPSIADLKDSFGGAAPSKPGDSKLPPPKKNGFYWMLDWNSFLEVGDGDKKVNIRFEPKLGDPQMFLPVTVP